MIIEQVLGSGNFGQVYKGVWQVIQGYFRGNKKGHIHVALKKLVEMTESFDIEANLLEYFSFYYNSHFLEL